MLGRKRSIGFYGSMILSGIYGYQLFCSGLEVRDRLWLKISIPHAFIGKDKKNYIREQAVILVPA
jgi:hypothetical protein